MNKRKFFYKRRPYIHRLNSNVLLRTVYYCSSYPEYIGLSVDIPDFEECWIGLEKCVVKITIVMNI